MSPPNPPLNLPLKRGRVEEEKEEQNTSAGDQNKNNNKRARNEFLWPERNRKRPSFMSDLGAKWQKLNSNRTSAEQNVEKLNERFNQAIGKDKISDGISIKINTVNVNSLRNVERMKRMGTLIKYWDSDIIVLVDTRVESKEANKLNRSGRKSFSTDNKMRGVIINVKETLEPKMIDMDEKNANYVAITINVQGSTIAVIGVYGPNERSTNFYSDTLPALLSELSIISDEIIVAGDLNVNISKSMGYAPNKHKKLDDFKRMQKRFKLNDPVEYYAKKNDIYPLTYVHTRIEEKDSTNNPFQAARLDGIFTTYDPLLCRPEIKKFYPSDHASIQVRVKIRKETGSKPWKMNTAYLKDVTLMRHWQKTAKRFSDSSETLEEKLDLEEGISEHRKIEVLGRNAYKNWKILVGIVKSTSIKKAREEEKERDLEKEKMFTKVEAMESSRAEVNEMLDEINKNEIVKQVIKSEIKNKQLNLENKRLAKFKAKTYVQAKKIVRVVIGNEVLTNPDKIKEGIKSYYNYQFRCSCKNLQKPKMCTICSKGLVEYARRRNQNLKRSHIRNKKVTNSMRYKLDQDITIDEMDRYVKVHLNKKHKSPGPDGIPVRIGFNALGRLEKNYFQYNKMGL